MKSIKLLGYVAKELQLSQEIEKELQLNLRSYPSDIQQETTYILLDLLKYPSNQLAQRHHHANKLGCSDIRKTKANAVNTEQHFALQIEAKHQHCEDCGLIIQQKQIPVCTDFHRFPNVGIAAYLLFLNMKNMIILVLFLSAIYSGYALYINISEPSQILSLNNYAIKLSYASQLLHVGTNSSLFSAMQIEGWLMVVTVLVWWIILSIVKLFNNKYQRMVDQQTITAADFSVMIENVPISCTQQQMQKEFDRYYQQVSKFPSFKQNSDKIAPFVIKKISKAIPFQLLQDEEFDQQIQAKQQKVKKQRQLFALWIEQVKQNGKFSQSKEQRKKHYQEYLKLKAQIKQQKQSKASKIKEIHDNDNEDIRTTVFVCFNSSESSNTVIQINPQHFSDKIRYALSCHYNALYFNINDKNNKSLNVVVNKAPEPEDIIWQNIGISQQSIILRKLLTYFILILLLAGSFGFVYELTLLQITYPTDQILSIAVSISITVINIVIGVVIRKLTLYEKDFTVTKHQISLSIKSIAAQLMNSILVPVITNIYIEKNIYQVNGLVYDVFYLGLTNALLPPLLKIIDAEYLVMSLLAWWKKRPYSKLTLTQKQLNSVCQQKVYEVGVAYVYFVNMFYFTCFYVTMHPSIVLFATLGFFCMYWAEKYSLLYRSSRPTPSSSLLGEAMHALISFGPCVISLGSLTWYNLLPANDTDFGNVSYVSRLVSVILSVLFFLFPFNSILDAICHVPQDELLDYQTCRLQLTSQYDRLNPATMEQGIDDFMDYLKHYEKQQKPNINGMIQLLAKKPKSNAVAGQPKTPLKQQSYARKIQKSSESTVAPLNKQLNVSDELMIESFQDEPENRRYYQQSTDKILVGNNTPSRKARRPVNNQQTKSKPRKSAMHQNLKGYHQDYIKNNAVSLDSKNPYSNLNFII